MNIVIEDGYLCVCQNKFFLKDFRTKSFSISNDILLRAIAKGSEIETVDRV